MAAQQPSSAFSIPTIDIEPYLKAPNSNEAEEIVEKVKEACTTTGFFSLVGHGVPIELQRRVFDGCKALFDLPIEEKRRLISPVLKNRGYEVIGAQALQADALPDLKEVRLI
jgi:isopenicillin N synthase-like dioxygenase